MHSSYRIRTRITSIALLLALVAGLAAVCALPSSAQAAPALSTNTPSSPPALSTTVQKPALASTQAASTTVVPFANKAEMRGIWLPYVDFQSLGLYDVNETTYRANLRSIFKKARGYGINVVFFHVRAHDDALWKSDYFPACSYFTSKANRSTPSKTTYSYDPLVAAVDVAHECGLELHAWLNPYRLNADYYFDPGDAKSRSRVLLAVKEVLACGVDGIQFDDYFYHANQGYKRSSNYQAVDASVTSKVYKAPDASTMLTNVNTLVKQVNAAVHKSKGAVFGISPQGNWENCMSSGADVQTWLSTTGYIDYIAPQIYWSDQWGAQGKVTMFSNRLKQFSDVNTAQIPFYVGLAAWRTGYAQSDDLGWGKRNDNLASQVKKLRKAGIKGWIIYRASDLNRSAASKEFKNLKAVVYSAKASGFNYPTKIARGCDFKLKGTLSAPASSIRCVEIGIVDTNTGTWVPGHRYRPNVGKKTLSLSKAQKSLHFSTLPQGSYRYRVWVYDMHGTKKKVIDKPFTVVKKLSTKFTKLTYPKKKLKAGKAYAVSGTLKTSIAIKRIEVGIVDESTNTWVYRYNNNAVNAKNFKLAKAAPKLKFQKLAKGNYRFRIWVHTAQGYKRVLNKPFKVV